MRECLCEWAFVSRILMTNLFNCKAITTKLIATMTYFYGVMTYLFAVTTCFVYSSGTIFRNQTQVETKVEFKTILGLDLRQNSLTSSRKWTQVL